MKFIESVFEKLRRHPKRIVFTEGADPRVITAAANYVRLKMGAPILLGKKEAILQVAFDHKIDINRIGIIDPNTAQDLPAFCQRLEKLQRYRNIGKEDARTIVTNPNYFGAMMIQYGQADGLIGGVTNYAGTVIRPLIQLVKPLPDMKIISSCTMVDVQNSQFGENGVLFFADCAIVPEPNVEELANITVETARICRQLTGISPRVAMLSFSTKGSGSSPAAERIRAAGALAHQKAAAEGMEVEIDGELQVDTALLPGVAAHKAPNSSVGGKANVLIFPDLNSGNIGLKLVQTLAGASAYGQILLGLSKPCAVMTRSASTEDILGVAAILGLQANEFRKIYPQEGEDESADQGLARPQVI